MKKLGGKLPWYTWVWLIPLLLTVHAVFEHLRGNGPLSTYQWVARNFMSALDSASEGSFGSLLLFVFVAALLLIFALWLSHWYKAEKIIDETQLKKWARRKYLEEQNLDNHHD